MKRLVTVLIACTIVEALQTLTPQAEWVLNGDTEAGLTWLDKAQTQPTSAQIAQAISDCQIVPPAPTLDQRMTELEDAVQTISVQTNVPVSLPLAVGP